MVSAPFPNRPFNLRENVWLIQQNTGTVQSLVGWELWIDKTGYSPTYSNDGQADRDMILNGNIVGSSNVRGFNFSGNGPWLILSGQSWVQHNSDGTLTLPIRGRANYAILGYAEVNSSLPLPTIPTYGPPNPPINGWIENITYTGMRYHFQDGGGGIPVDSYQTRWSVGEQPDWATATWWYAPMNGVVDVDGLQPGSMVWFQTRANNSRGSSAFGADANARTYSVAHISDGTKWIDADVQISDGTKWLPADVLISDGTKWQPAG